MVTTAYLQKVQTVKCRPNLYDDPERRIVGIMHTERKDVVEKIYLYKHLTNRI